MNKIIKNKRGISTLVFAFGLMMLLTVIYFGTDIIKINNGMSVMSQGTTEIARIASIQGGIGSRKPSHFPGEYITIDDLDGLIERKMGAVGYSKDQYSIEIKPINAGGRTGKVGSNGVSPSGNFDYKTEFEVVSTLKYEWFFSSITMGIEKDREASFRRVGMSEWKFNYGNWDGE